MRVTELMVERNFLHNMRRAEFRLIGLQDRASSGLAFTRPQDDPVGVGRSVTLRHHLAHNHQYLRNIDKARSWMEATEQALSELTAVLSRAQELALYAGTDTVPGAARNAIKSEVSQLREEAACVALRTFEDRKVLTGTLPKWQVGPETMMDGTSLDHLLDDIDRALGDFETAAGGAEIRASWEGLTRAYDSVMAERARNGGRMARLDMLEDKLNALDVEYTRLLSGTEDVDLAEVIMRLRSAEASYQAALGAGARLIQPCLLDFLR